MLLGLVAGCGGEPTGQVTGRVMYNGQRAAGASVLFIAANDEQRQFAGVSGRSGEYYFTYPEVRELPVGRYKVTITVPTIPSGIPLPPGEHTQALKAAGEVAMTPFLFEKDVVAGLNTLDFELTQGAKQEAAAEKP